MPYEYCTVLGARKGYRKARSIFTEPALRLREELRYRNGSYKLNLEVSMLVVGKVNSIRQFCFAIAGIRIIGLCARMWGPCFSWYGPVFSVFVLVFVVRAKIFGVIFAPFPEEGTLDYIA